jgi:hypothetical protein
MLTSYADVKKQVLTEIKDYELMLARHPEDRLSEMADSTVPIYYGDIIEEWREMPIEYTDRWQEFGTDSSATITKLMQIDLFIYYQELFSQAFAELSKEYDDEADSEL